ncbi:MAG: redoxin family protein [Gammaproteobacteria bacterium]|nr:redoxin family protein [Gammaproteobacteria bacterium]
MSRTKLDIRKIRSLLLNAAVLFVIFFGVAAFQSRNMLATDGVPAPELRGMTLAGLPYDLADAGGRPALVYFFAPWCRICGASADNLNRLRRWRNAGDIEIVAVGLDWSTSEEVRDYVERHELNVTVVLGDGDVARQWQIQAFPSYYVLNSEHRIVRRDIGYSTQFGLWWRAWRIS